MKYSIPKKIVLIGASTGGPGQIQQIISSLPSLQNTTIVIAQHMVKGFIPSFIQRLNEHTDNNVLIAENNDSLACGNIYICDGDTQVLSGKSGLLFKNKLAQNNSYNPDINILFNSLIPFSKNIEILSVILTGIGEDGVDACKKLSLNGATCLTETKQSAIVDGMPSRARDIVPNIQALNIEEITKKIEEFCN